MPQRVESLLLLNKGNQFVDYLDYHVTVDWQRNNVVVILNNFLELLEIGSVVVGHAIHFSELSNGFEELVA